MSNEDQQQVAPQNTDVVLFHLIQLQLEEEHKQDEQDQKLYEALTSDEDRKRMDELRSRKIISKRTYGNLIKRCAEALEYEGRWKEVLGQKK